MCWLYWRTYLNADSAFWAVFAILTNPSSAQEFIQYLIQLFLAKSFLQRFLGCIVSRVVVVQQLLLVRWNDSKNITGLLTEDI